MRVFWIVAAMVLASGAAAQEVKRINTSESMLHFCEGTYPDDSHPELQKIMCKARVHGILEMMQQNCGSAASGFTPRPEFSMARPPSVGAAQQAFRNYMEANPQVWGAFWSHSVILALSSAFPCEAE